MVRVWSCLLPLHSRARPLPLRCDLARPPLHSRRLRSGFIFFGQKDQERKKKTVQNSVSVLACKPCVKVDECERQLPGAESLQNFPERARERERERERSSSRDEILGSLEARVQLEHFSLPPPSFLPPLPALSDLLHFLLRFLTSRLLRHDGGALETDFPPLHE